jgi:hypothetical protein
VWLPDCNNTLQREYWRVFAKGTTSAYIIPRPDGAPELRMSVCGAPEHPMRALVDRYSLCESATSAAAVDRVNDMDPADALALVHYLHTQLLFTTTVNPVMDPTPPPTLATAPFGDDVLAACALRPAENSVPLEALCEDERQALKSGLEIGRDYDAVATELAPLLNELYGVGASCARGEDAEHVCMECGVVGGCPRIEVNCSRPCTTRADCAGVSSGEECLLGVCGPVAECL